MTTIRHAHARPALLGLAAVLALLPAPAPAVRAMTAGPLPQQTVLDVILSNPFYNPRLGLPDFVTPASDPELQEAARTVAEVLWADLDFEKEFYMIPRAESAAIPVAATPSAIALDRWSQLGADHVIHATARRAGTEFEIDLRLIAVRGAMPGRQSFGARYQHCTTQNPRSCAHFIADDFHKQTRALDGVAQTKLAFVSDRDAARMSTRFTTDAGISKEIYIADYDGHRQTRVTANRTLALHPAWSPDARTLAYTLYLDGGAPDLFLNTLDGRPVVRPLPATGDIHQMLATWSPDGTRLAFASNRADNWDIWVMNRDGTSLRNLTPNTPRSIETSPAWSPTGLQVAFVSDRTGGRQLYTVNVDGTGLQRLTSGTGDVDRPTWSPLNFIAYTAGSGPGHNISIFDLTTFTISVITDGLGDNGSPAVAPNGRHIAFMTTRWGREQIAVIGRNGRHLRRITTTGTNSSPSWSRTRAR